MYRLSLLLATFLLAACALAQNQPSAAASANSRELDVSGSQQWTDTGVDVAPGESVTATASVSLHFADGTSAGPGGATRGWKDLLRSLPVNSAGRGALIGRVGSDDAAQPFLIGVQSSLKIRVAGRLFVGLNETSNDSPQGSFHVVIAITGAANAAAATPAAPAGTSSGATVATAPVAVNLGGSSPTATVPSSASVAAATSPAGGETPASTAPSSASSSPSDAALAASLPKDLFSEIPRRVTDKDGNVGDMVNFLLIGSEDQVKATFQAAGWVQVYRDVKDAVLEGFVTSLSKQVYLTMPMSQLYLFGRPQDYGFAHAEPLKVVTTRHHLRVWKSTLAVAGAPVWVGAATHDMGLERDQRNGKLTHHIDPNVDDERSFVERSLTESGTISQHTRVLPPNPVQDAKTATGGGFHSNGEVLVMRLAN